VFRQYTYIRLLYTHNGMDPNITNLKANHNTCIMLKSDQVWLHVSASLEAINLINYNICYTWSNCSTTNGLMIASSKAETCSQPLSHFNIIQLMCLTGSNLLLLLQYTTGWTISSNNKFYINFQAKCRTALIKIIFSCNPHWHHWDQTVSWNIFGTYALQPEFRKYA
jgi:hypothetical protein